MSSVGRPEIGRQSLMTVVDCSDTAAGQFAASVLAGRGALVLRPAGGGPPQNATELFTARGVHPVPQPDGPDGPDGWDTLISRADVLLVGGPAGDWGTVASVTERTPGLIVIAVTSHGLANHDPSRRATALTLAAESGLLGITGEPDGAPEPIRGHVTEFACGWGVASATWAALRQRRITGLGMVVDLSLLEMFVFLQWNATQRAAFEGVVMQRQGARGLGHPWGVYPCKGGHVILIVGAGGRNWARFAELMGVSELADSRYQSAAARAQHADEIDALMLPWLFEHTAEEIFTMAQKANLPFGMVRRPADLLVDQQFEAREFFIEEEDGLRWPQMPIRINGARPNWVPVVAGGRK